MILPNAKTLPPSAYGAKNYFSFFLQTIQRRFLYRVWRTARGIFRPFFFVARTLRVLGLAIAFSALLLVLLPALLLSALVFLIAGAGAVRRAVRMLPEAEAGKRFLFVFVGQSISPCYLALAAEFDGAVLFVCESPRRASGGKLRFPAACYPFAGGYLITQRCYFRLRRVLPEGTVYGRVF